MNKLIQYFKDSKIELKKVTWPTKQETINHTLIVIGISIAMAIFLGIIDYFLTIGIEKLL
ncbi:preprotein translocase subunit SecE [Candidatus Kuenenbacteria bacterium HGW-Kuenenbacteria-1]|uniref:Protein translocase subunit SecE n=1 Tax=Candidatus Kuenenbacteria bacterium HGW-Kuenenbacteria-1 TaxID=2013812 RepID=A0A2N1UP47_9BACT|nr:MAG: preprotein translocase subunit SecE [Candidatus Kuenenbacteria bacterium HGW-Kuenenbacteria-1]